MKSFLFSIRNLRIKDGTTYKQIKVWRVKRNIPSPIGTMDFTYMDDMQAFLEYAESHKLLPSKAFERNANTNGYIFYTRSSLTSNGIAYVTQI